MYCKQGYYIINQTNAETEQEQQKLSNFQDPDYCVARGQKVK